jgi:hypothetical protein
MSNVIPAVRFEYLIEVNNQYVEDHELYLEALDDYQQPYIEDTVISVLKGRASPDETMSVLLRSCALQNFVTKHNDLAPWFSEEENVGGKMTISEPLFKAAARAPLAHAGPTIRGIIFDKKPFMPILLEETDVEGKA